MLLIGLAFFAPQVFLFSMILHLLIYFSIYYSKPNKSKNHTRTFVQYLRTICKNGSSFYLEKNQSSQNRSSRTVSAGPVVVTSLYGVIAPNNTENLQYEMVNHAFFLKRIHVSIASITTNFHIFVLLGDERIPQFRLSLKVNTFLYSKACFITI